MNTLRPYSERLKNQVFNTSTQQEVTAEVGSSDSFAAPRKETCLSVLVVEDTQSERLFIAQLIESYGFKVTTCDDGEQALELWANHQFDIVVSDWRMPTLTGLQLCQHLKQSTTPPYFILLTANNQSTHLVEGIVAGADDFITKPFAPSELKVRLLAASRILQMQLTLKKQNQQLNQVLAHEKYLHQQRQTDLQSAAQLQQSLLPKPQVDLKQWQFNTSFKPALELAGDLFQIVEIDNENIGFYLLDVAGHGAASAMHAFTLAQQLNHSLADWQGLDPALLMNKLNFNYQDPEQAGRFTTGMIAIINTTTQVLTICNAGHPAPLIFDIAWKVAEMPTELPLGIHRSHKYKNHIIPLHDIAQLLLYSDGAYECHHPCYGEFGQQRLQSLCQNAHSLQPQKLIYHINHSLELWQQHQPQDDTSLMLISAPKETV
ncbi:SpoIIE family protein phosphatase [Shewanella gelidii]|uniref:Response regulatory domain-containing protein n=1 Tax=Shewanella gelidii TaxID=1642821 RepID=A0A917JHE3_9GAMM|nr:SpoIIE family protein phosphatase [Shewanella gelidii]MCL1096394.1 SpoIIE family protein phosphatase [Shewanella gelidii]GGI67148.1 hypothetical protein GCM10009332_00230 [Shewanella gelidii]